MSNIIQKVNPILEPVIEAAGYELVDMEYVKEGPEWYLRIYADKPGGITLNDCVSLSELVSEHLDQIQPDPFPKAYYLEVSSPGAERPLKTEAAIKAAIGSYVHFDYYVPQHGEKQHEGTLLVVDEESYQLEVQIMSKKKTLVIDKTAVAKTRLAVKI